MVSESQWDTLNRAFGYEMAVLLIDRSMTKSEIQSQLPYENVHKKQVDRIISSCWAKDLIIVAAEPGTDKYTLNRDQFSDSELEEVNEKAVARILNPDDQRVGPGELNEIPERFFVKKKREDYIRFCHADFINTKSKFALNRDNNDVDTEHKFGNEE